jgi:hypothetical protein
LKLRRFEENEECTLFYEEPFWANARPDRHHAIALEAANDAVSDFVRFVRDNNIRNDLVDEIELPLPKPVLVDAFARVIAAEDRTDIRTLLVKAGLTLSQYHVGLGERIKVRPAPANAVFQASSPFLARRLACAILLTATERARLMEVYKDALRRGRH